MRPTFSFSNFTSSQDSSPSTFAIINPYISFIIDIVFLISIINWVSQLIIEIKKIIFSKLIIVYHVLNYKMVFSKFFVGLLESASSWVVILTSIRLPTFGSPQTPRKRDHTGRLLLLLLSIWCVHWIKPNTNFCRAFLNTNYMFLAQVNSPSSKFGIPQLCHRGETGFICT